MWTNFHTHTSYCDGKGSFQDFIDVGETKSLGFSSHAPLPFSTSWAMKSELLSDYLNQIQQLKEIVKSTEIYAGLEVDYIPGLIAPTDFKNLDYTVGSIHFVDSFISGVPWEIDGLHSLFLEGLKSIFKNNHQKAWGRYFELTREMIREAPPTILGHLDKMKIQNTDSKFFSESETWYRNEIKETIAAIKQTNIVVEVNTRGIYQKKSATTYPSPWILELIKEAKIPITLSSDAHHPQHLISEFGATAILLAKIGFKKISILTQGQWKEVNFSQNGIHFES